jgi:SHS2 domain-containing protein
VTSGTPDGAAAAERHRTPFGSVEFRPHASDLTVELRGHSAQDLFRLGAWALARTQAPTLAGEISAEAEFEVVGDGWDDLLVNWLNQLLFLTERHRAVWTEVEFARLDDSGLAAKIKGCPAPEGAAGGGREVKAASYVGLELVPGPSLWMARVKLDL